MRSRGQAAPTSAGSQPLPSPEAAGADAEGLVAALRARVHGEVRADEPLAPHTTLRVGGPAAALVTAADPADLAAVADVCARHGRPWLILGRGSNLLVADAGWPGVVVTLGRGFRGIARDGDRLVAGGAEPMPALAKRAEEEGLAGLAFGVAIPGSVGGAVRMNAGAHGGQVADTLAWVEVARLGHEGARERLLVSQLTFTYRHSTLPADAVVERACFACRPAATEELAVAMDGMRRWRRAHQPLGEPSCGSVFRNPPGDSAGRLIDAAGMKGHRVGGARVSERHANFIVVERGARADDVHAVLRAAQQAVATRFGVALQPEVVVAGYGAAPGGPDSPRPAPPGARGT